MRRLGQWVLCVLLVGVVARADAGAVVTELRVPGRPNGVRFADANGDGKPDVFVIFGGADASAAVSRGVAVYLRDGDAFTTDPARVVAAGRDVLFADVADLDGDGASSVYFVTTGGLEEVGVHGDDAPSPARRIELPSFFRAAAGALLPEFRVVLDIDRDGSQDVLLPGRDGFVFYRGRGATGLAEPVTLTAEISHGVESGENAFFRSTSRIARPAAMDWDGDGAGDLVLTTEERATCIPFARDGVPGVPRALFDLTATLGEGDRDEQGLVFTTGTLRDIDGDGRCDLILTRRTARPNLLSAVTTRTIVYRAEDLARADGPRPVQVVRTEGIATRPMLADFDQDGALDMVLAIVKADAVSKLKETLLDQAQVDFLIFPFDKKKHRFASEPVASLVQTVATDRLMSLGAAGDVTFTADYDGDGRPDFSFYDSRAHTFVVRRGVREEGFFSSTPITFQTEPFLSVGVDLPGGSNVTDANGDGRPDVVSWGDGRVVIVEQRG